MSNVVQGPLVFVSTKYVSSGRFVLDKMSIFIQFDNHWCLYIDRDFVLLSILVGIHVQSNSLNGFGFTCTYSKVCRFSLRLPVLY